MKSFTILKGVELTLTAILAGTLTYGTVHAEGQTAKKSSVSKHRISELVYADFQYHSDLFATLILTLLKFKCFILAYYFWSHLYMN